MKHRRVLLQPAFILHRRQYKNSSWLLDIFSREIGRLTLVAKGARRPQYRERGYLQAFQPLLLSWTQGRSELGTLIGVEPDGSSYILGRKSLYSAFYINELLVRLMAPFDPHPEVFQLYRQVLDNLTHGETIEPVLRLFERDLLQQLGYGLVLDRDNDGKTIIPEGVYRYLLEQGPMAVTNDSVPGDGLLVDGDTLLKLAAGRLVGNERVLQQSKHLMRHVLQHYLGPAGLKSRELYRQMS